MDTIWISYGVYTYVTSALQKENEQVKAENEALQSQVDDLQSKYEQIMEMLAAQGMEVE